MKEQQNPMEPNLNLDDKKIFGQQAAGNNINNNTITLTSNSSNTNDNKVFKEQIKDNITNVSEEINNVFCVEEIEDFSSYNNESTADVDTIVSAANIVKNSNAIVANCFANKQNGAYPVCNAMEITEHDSIVNFKESSCSEIYCKSNDVNSDVNNDSKIYNPLEEFFKENGNKKFSLDECNNLLIMQEERDITNENEIGTSEDVVKILMKNEKENLKDDENDVGAMFPNSVLQNLFGKGNIIKEENINENYYVNISLGIDSEDEYDEEESISEKIAGWQKMLVSNMELEDNDEVEEDMRTKVYWATPGLVKEKPVHSLYRMDEIPVSTRPTISTLEYDEMVYFSNTFSKHKNCRSIEKESANTFQQPFGTKQVDFLRVKLSKNTENYSVMVKNKKKKKVGIGKFLSKIKFWKRKSKDKEEKMVSTSRRTLVQEMPTLSTVGEMPKKKK